MTDINKKYQKEKKKNARLDEKISFLKKTNKELQEERKQLISENNILLNENKDKRKTNEIRKENKKLKNYVIENPGSVESNKVFKWFSIFMFGITFLFIIGIFWLCFYSNIPNDYRKFMGVSWERFEVKVAWLVEER